MSITLTSKEGKEKEHDGVEEAEAHGQGILMDYSGDDEHGEHSSCFEFPFRQLQGSEKEQRGFGSWFRGQVVQWGICVTRITRLVLNYYAYFILCDTPLWSTDKALQDITLLVCFLLLFM